MSAFRRCPVRESVTLLAPDRLITPPPPAPSRAGPCVLCPGGPAATGRVLGRRNLAFACAVGRPALRVEASDAGYLGETFASREGLGAHEVVVADPRHDRTPATLSAGGWADALLLARERMRDLRHDLRLRGITWFSPWRQEAGAAVDHVHLQVLALPEPTPHERSERGRGKHCTTCAMLSAEDGRRIVRSGDAAVSLCPWAPQVDFEAWVLPREHHGAFESSADAAIFAVAGQLAELLGRLDAALGSPALAIALRAVAPGHEGHWRIEVRPCLGPVPAIAWASGLHVCTVTPEDAAEHLRARVADGHAPR